MATQVMSPRPDTVRVKNEPTVRAIIDAARSRPQTTPGRGAWTLSFVTGALLWGAFTPLDWGSLGWIALVPLILLVRPEHRARKLYLAVYTAGFAWALATLQWMRLGDPAMYYAWVALSLYVAVYFPLFVGLARVAVHRFAMPLVVAVPVVWVGLEYLRAYVITGFSWYYLGHTQYRWIELIQISDLVGAYGVSFLVAAANACVAGLIPESVLVKMQLIRTSPSVADSVTANSTVLGRRNWAPVAFCLVLFGTVLTYGYIRRAQAEFHEGPRIALVQANFPTEIKHDPLESQRIFDQHYDLTGLAVREQPDLIVWPETMYRAPLLVRPPEMTETDLLRSTPFITAENWQKSDVPQVLTRLSQQVAAPMIFGVDTIEAVPDSFRRYNSAAFVRPDAGLVARYDKLHPVMFGEYVPLRDTFPWLANFAPFPPEFGLTPGDGSVLFQHKGWRYAPIICFEDTVPHLVREIVHSAADDAEGRRPVDCLVNLTNDGWFHGSSELDQHLITAAFRCVECRVPMVRAVNTGISAVIDGDGVVIDPDALLVVETSSQGEIQPRDVKTMRDPATGRWRKEVDAVVVDAVPLDNRTSLYVAMGDWFAGTCGFAAVSLLLSGLIPRRQKPVAKVA